jgi:hypothetical protein
MLDDVFACQFDKKKTCLRCFCLKGFVIAIVKTKVYRYNELRSKLVYRIKLLQRAGLDAGTAWEAPANPHVLGFASLQ